MPSRLVHRSQPLTCCLLLQGRRHIRFLWNFGTNLPDYMASHPRRPWSSHTVLWEPQISHDTIRVVLCSVCRLESNTFSFQNTSVLENHHWRSAIGCLLESNVAEQLGACRLELEQQISSLILATDITRQQEFLSRFKVMNIAYSFVMCIIWLSTRLLLLGFNAGIVRDRYGSLGRICSLQI